MKRFFKNWVREMISQIPIALIVNSGDFVLSFFDIEKENNPMYGYIKWGIVISLSIIYLFIYCRKGEKKEN